MEEHRVLVYVLQEVLTCSLAIGVKLDFAVSAVKVQLGV